VYLGSEYIEFSWVENKKTYQQGKSDYHDTFRKNPAPFGYGFESQNIEKFHSSLIRRGFKIPKLFSRGPADASTEEKPWWTFQLFPRNFLPGVLPFALKYEIRDYKAPRKAHQGPNRIFALSGVIFVASNPKKDFEKWKHVFLARGKCEKGVCHLRLGSHLLSWMKLRDFVARYGERTPLVPSGRFRTLRKTALLHLLSDNLSITNKYLTEGGWKTKLLRVDGTICLYVKPRLTDGFAFLVSEDPTTRRF